MVRFVVDDPARARKTFDNEGLSYQETEIAEAKLPHRPGELARAASRLGEANIKHRLRVLRSGSQYEYASADFWRRRGWTGGCDLGSDSGCCLDQSRQYAFHLVPHKVRVRGFFCAVEFFSTDR